MWNTRRWLLIGFMGVGIGIAAEKGGELSGTWKMDAARSESAHQEGPVEASTVVIEMSGSDVTVETTRDEGGKPGAFHEKLYFRLDGSETTGTGDGGVAVTGKARMEKGRLVLDTARKINDATVTTQYAYSVSP